MEQPQLFEPLVDCERGLHGSIVDEAPRDLGESVNVDHRCSSCQRVVSITSYTKAAWTAHVAKQQRSNWTDAGGRECKP